MTSSRFAWIITVLFFGVCATWTDSAYSQEITDEQISAELEKSNAEMAIDGLEYGIGMIETLVVPGSGEKGRTIVARNVGNKRLNAQFVYADPRRGSRPYITYLVDVSDGVTRSGLDAAATEPAVDSGMATWSQAIPSVPIVKLADLGEDYDRFDLILAVYSILFGKTCVREDFPPGRLLGNPDMDGNGTVDIDIIHGGWLPACAFSWMKGGDSILAVTVTWVYLDQDLKPSDINGDGRSDVAFREIFYNDRFQWGVSGAADTVDVESIALHEAGHGLSIAHFGTVFVTDDGTWLAKPTAVMNPVYQGVRQNLYGIDKAALNASWRAWNIGKSDSRTLRRR